MLKMIYTSYIMPIIEYCAIVWDPLKVGTGKTLETIQRRYTRIMMRIKPDPRRNNYKTYDERIVHLDIDTLAERRKRARIIFLAKLAKGEIKCSELFNEITPAVQLRVTRHHLPYTLEVARSLAYYRQPIIACMQEYNERSRLLTAADSINTIRNKLKKQTADQRAMTREGG